MEERRNISRVDYKANGVVVVCETGESYFVETKNVSPLGMGLVMKPDTPELVGKDIIIVASTLIMYADVNRQVKNEDGTYTVGIHARQFTPEVLEYLFKHIA
ncbi:MAG: PilZ domain-containing protein [Lachnospiraceae bacterium]|nr:PilZ domain-containing protein [Lachnospiraceae bacterium]